MSLCHTHIPNSVNASVNRIQCLAPTGSYSITRPPPSISSCVVPIATIRRLATAWPRAGARAVGCGDVCGRMGRGWRRFGSARIWGGNNIQDGSLGLILRRRILVSALQGPVWRAEGVGRNPRLPSREERHPRAAIRRAKCPMCCVARTAR